MNLNLPNKITLSRIFIIPVIVFLYLADFIPFNKLFAAVLFVLAISTDFIDGNIARKRNLVTNLGKFLDPIADKLINITVLILITADHIIPSPYGELFAIILISRELIISAFRQIAATNGVVIAADKLGKLKTVLQDIAIAALVVLSYFIDHNYFNFTFTNNSALGIFASVVAIIAYGFAALSAVLTVISLDNYFQKNKQVLK